MNGIIKITGRQIAAARALVRIEQTDLAKAANISVPALRRMEASGGPAVGMANNVAAVRAALKSAGVIFVDEKGEGHGVRLRKGAMRATPATIPVSLTNEQWDRIERELPGRVGDPGCNARDNRLFVEAVLWIARTRSPWRDLPRGYGKWYTAYTRCRRWSQTGVWKAIFEALSDDPDFEFVLIDETICLQPAKTLTERDLRDSVIEQTVKQLEQLEHKFRDGDPVREVIAFARRMAAAQLVVTATVGDTGPKVVKAAKGGGAGVGLTKRSLAGGLQSTRTEHPEHPVDAGASSATSPD